MILNCFIILIGTFVNYIASEMFLTLCKQ